MFKYIIYYKTHWDSVNIHFNACYGWTQLPGIPMKKEISGEFKDYFVFEINCECDCWVFVCFNNNNGEWDSNFGANYTLLESGVYKFETGYNFRKIKHLGYKKFSSVPYLLFDEFKITGTSIVINYSTKNEFKGIVNYGTDKENLQFEQIEERERDIHHIKLNNLKPDTTYWYSVLNDENYSQIYHFKTPNINSKSYNYILVSDLQDGIQGESKRKWKETANEIKNICNNDKIDFIVFLGDLIESDVYENWKIFFDKGKDIFPFIPIIPVLGNHDTGQDETHAIYGSCPNESKNYETFFSPLLNNGKTYSFCYKNSYFLILNTEPLIDIISFDYDPQYNWTLTETDKNCKNFDWNFALFHIPPYNMLERQHFSQKKIRPITKLFDGKIDWCFSAHVHSYQRFNPLSFNGIVKEYYGKKENEGIGYLILPCGGNYPEHYETIHKDKFKNKIAFPSIQQIESGIKSELGFSKVTIDDKYIKIETFGMGNLKKIEPLHLIDKIEYKKII